MTVDPDWARVHSVTKKPNVYAFAFRPNPTKYRAGGDDGWDGRTLRHGDCWLFPGPTPCSNDFSSPVLYSGVRVHGTSIVLKNNCSDGWSVELNGQEHRFAWNATLADPKTWFSPWLLLEDHRLADAQVMSRAVIGEVAPGVVGAYSDLLGPRLAVWEKGSPSASELAAVLEDACLRDPASCGMSTTLDNAFQLLLPVAASLETTTVRALQGPELARVGAGRGYYHARYTVELHAPADVRDAILELPSSAWVSENPKEFDRLCALALLGDE